MIWDLNHFGLKSVCYLWPTCLRLVFNTAINYLSHGHVGVQPEIGYTFFTAWSEIGYVLPAVSKTLKFPSADLLALC